jgi:uncharacterized OsmC-like protein/pimeloyl-ACP methyl ester carboxylesterase
MAREKVGFNAIGGQQLSAIIDRPDGEVRAYALFAHCFTCSKNLRAAVNIAAALNDAGIAVLRFDFTGLGESEGEFADSNFSSNVEELVAAANYLEENFQAPAILVGHSLGGTAVLQAAARIPSAVAVATIASPSQPAHVAALLENDRAEIESSGQATVQLGGRPFVIKKQFLDDLQRHALPDSVSSLRKALLIMHAPLDAIVGIDNASELFMHAKHPKSFVSLDQADHLLSRKEDSRYAGAVLAAWASRYLPMAAPPDVLDGPTADATQTVARTFAAGFATQLTSAGHELIADEPVRYGGTGKGPSPFDLLSAALASCTTMTLRMYAARKKMDLKSSTVRVTHAKIHAQECADCETRSGKVDEFQRELTLDGDLSTEQRQRLLEIADMCPVHRALHNEVKIRTTLAA